MSYKSYLDLQSRLQNYHSHEELQEIIHELKAFFREGSREEIYPFFNPHVKYPLYLRRGTSDFLNFIQIFLYAEYSPCFSYVPETILDLGAYIGLSAIYFANRFPDAKIICVEPSADNYDLLKLNTKPYPNIFRINAAIWSHPTQLKIVNQIGGDWGNILAECQNARETRDTQGDRDARDAGDARDARDTYDARDARDTHDTRDARDEQDEGDEGIEAISIANLVDRFHLTKIDFLKIDIEGSEKQVFSEQTERWLPLVQVIACETHDRFVEGCTASYENLFKNDNFDYFQTGEFRTFVRKDVSLLDRVKFGSG